MIVANSNGRLRRRQRVGLLAVEASLRDLYPGIVNAGIDTAGIVIAGIVVVGVVVATQPGIVGIVIFLAGISLAGIVVAGISTGGTLTPGRPDLFRVGRRGPCDGDRDHGDREREVSRTPTHHYENGRFARFLFIDLATGIVMVAGWVGTSARRGRVCASMRDRGGHGRGRDPLASGHVAEEDGVGAQTRRASRLPCVHLLRWPELLTRSA